MYHSFAGSAEKWRKNTLLDLSAGMWYNIQCWVGYVLHILLIGSILLAQGRAFFILL